MQTIYTIGHSNHSLDVFWGLISKHKINLIVDIRSVPMSHYAPQFDQGHLSEFLDDKGVNYIYLGKELGARRTDSINDNGQVDFELAMSSEGFQEGVKQVKDWIENGFQVTLMCSEADPLKCHRFSLVARYLHDEGFNVRHILSDGSWKSHSDLEQEMIHKYLRSPKRHLSEVNLLYTTTEQRNDAYRLKNHEIGYFPTTNNTITD